MVAEILVGAAAIRPANLRRYGEVDEQTAKWLELLAARLTELVDALEVSHARGAVRR